jgi:hypothetical protein
VLGTQRGLIGGGDLGVDLTGVVAVVTDSGRDPARVSGKGLGGGVEGSWAAIIDLAEVFDDLPDVRPEGQGGPAARRDALHCS